MNKKQILICCDNQGVPYAQRVINNHTNIQVYWIINDLNEYKPFEQQCRVMLCIPNIPDSICYNSTQCKIFYGDITQAIKIIYSVEDYKSQYIYSFCNDRQSQAILSTAIECFRLPHANFFTYE